MCSNNNMYEWNHFNVWFLEGLACQLTQRFISLHGKNSAHSCPSCMYRCISAWTHLTSWLPDTRSKLFNWAVVVDLIIQSYSLNDLERLDHLIDEIEEQKNSLKILDQDAFSEVMKFLHTLIAMHHYEEHNVRKARNHVSKHNVLYPDTFNKFLNSGINKTFPEELELRNLQTHIVPYIDLVMKCLGKPRLFNVISKIESEKEEMNKKRAFIEEIIADKLKEKNNANKKSNLEGQCCSKNLCKNVDIAHETKARKDTLTSVDKNDEKKLKNMNETLPKNKHETTNDINNKIDVIKLKDNIDNEVACNEVTTSSQPVTAPKNKVDNVTSSSQDEEIKSAPSSQDGEMVTAPTSPFVEELPHCSKVMALNNEEIDFQKDSISPSTKHPVACVQSKVAEATVTQETKMDKDKELSELSATKEENDTNSKTSTNKDEPPITFVSDDDSTPIPPKKKSRLVKLFDGKSLLKSDCETSSNKTSLKNGKVLFNRKNKGKSKASISPFKKFKSLSENTSSISNKNSTSPGRKKNLSSSKSKKDVRSPNDSFDWISSSSDDEDSKKLSNPPKRKTRTISNSTMNSSKSEAENPGPSSSRKNRSPVEVSLTWTSEEDIDDTVKKTTKKRKHKGSGSRKNFSSGSTAKKEKRLKFTLEEEQYLIKGIKRYGVGNWRRILDDFPFHDTRTNVSIKDKYRTMVKQGLIKEK